MFIPNERKTTYDNMKIKFETFNDLLWLHFKRNPIPLKPLYVHQYNNTIVIKIGNCFLTSTGAVI